MQAQRYFSDALSGMWAIKSAVFNVVLPGARRLSSRGN
jgi:hypothetical protein